MYHLEVAEISLPSGTVCCKAVRQLAGGLPVRKFTVWAKKGTHLQQGLCAGRRQQAAHPWQDHLQVLMHVQQPIHLQQSKANIKPPSGICKQLPGRDARSFMSISAGPR